jgi:hypothetical protein
MWPNPAMPARPLHVWHSTDPAAPDSIEGKLRAEGKHWKSTSGEIEVGSYVKDKLEGRLGQPEGRGAIGKVLLISSASGVPAAKVDFGRGYTPGIKLSELSPVKIVAEKGKKKHKKKKSDE